MGPKRESVQPKTGQTHRLFGLRSLKHHNFRDPKWKAMDKVEQYDALTRLHEKDQNLKHLTESAEKKKQYEKLYALQKEVKDDRILLKIAQYGDTQRVKNILQSDKTLQRLYQKMPAQEIVEKMDQRTFVKRKELDRLIHHRVSLTRSYETKLMELSKRQDQHQYIDSIENRDNILAKNLRMELKNSETRMRAIRTINRTYRRIIHRMSTDSIYFEPTLQALQEDLKEQDGFIKKTISMGIPALENLQRLTDEYEGLEQNTRDVMQLHLADIFSHREVINKNMETVKKLVRHDSDFEIFPKRYNRETGSMLKLKNHLEEVENVMKLVRKATSVSLAEKVYPRLRKQRSDNKKLEVAIIQREHEKVSLEKRDTHGDVIKESLIHNLTDEEIQRKEEIESIKEEIKNLHILQKVHNEELKGNGEIAGLLQHAFQHFYSVLQHVGDEHIPEEKQVDSDLNLPLLNFGAHAQKLKPLPTQIEDDVESLLKISKVRTRILMEKYDEIKPTLQVIADAENDYHKSILKDLTDDVIEDQDANERGDAPLIATAEIEDPNVPNRKFIKTMSKKIVEINKKKEED